jgi:hypothetical protein
MRIASSRLISLAALCGMLASSCENSPTGGARVSAVEIATDAAFLDAGSTLELRAELRDANGEVVDGPDVAWSTSDARVASVADGVVTGHSPGIAFVYAGLTAARDSVRIQVEAPVASLVVWPADTVRLIRERRLPILVEMSDASGSPASHSLEIRSSNEQVVAIREGAPVGVSLGRATLTFRAGSRSVPLEVEVVTGERFTFRRIDPLEPRALNNLGWAVGALAGKAALWRRGEITPLVQDRYAVSNALLVNDSGLVAGIGRATAAASPVLWTWRAGAVREIPLPLPGGVSGAILDLAVREMNLRGEIVGVVSARDAAASYSFHWDGAAVRVLPLSFDPWSINDHGVILGAHSIMENGVVRELPRPAFAQGDWTATSINERGQYTGFFSGGCYGGFLWDGTAYRDLNPLMRCMFYFAINEYSDLLGNYVGVASSGGGTGLIRDGKADYLYPWLPQPRVVSSVDLNDLGQVITTDNQARPPFAYLLTPGS